MLLQGLCRESAIVIPKLYTDIINPYNPIASAPIFCDMYELKNIPIQRRIREVSVRINPFKMNVFMNFIIFAPFKYGYM